MNRPSKRGDHFVEIELSVPKTLTPRQRELIEEFASLEMDRNGEVNITSSQRQPQKSSDDSSDNTKDGIQSHSNSLLTYTAGTGKDLDDKPKEKHGFFDELGKMFRGDCKSNESKETPDKKNDKKPADN